MGNKGFKGVIVRDNNTAQEIEKLREDVKKDFKKKLKKIEKKEKDRSEEQTSIVQKFQTFEAWNTMGQLQQNAAARLASLQQFAETSGPNAGRIVIPTTWDAKAQALFGRLLDNTVAQETDMQNGFSALRSLDLWTILSGEMGGGFTDSLFGNLLAFRFLSGTGLVAQPMFLGLPGVNPALTNLLLPRIFSSSIALISSGI